MATRFPRAFFLSLVTLPMLAATGWGQPAVFNGDPVDPATGQAYVMLPGLPLVLPGDDGKFGTGDDVVNPSLSGDVDVVLRTGGTFTGGAIPAPWSGTGVAPLVVPGGQHTGAGSEVDFQAILSDGATSPPGGNPLGGSELNSRGIVVFVFADLDDDGVIGPFAADGMSDEEIERQEALAAVGRQVAVFQNGIAEGSVGVSLGAPASAGGLGLVLAGGAVTGPTPPVYEDGPWIGTLLPFMAPIDAVDIIGNGNVRPPDPSYLVELEIEPEKLLLPSGDDPVLGGAYAVPLDGSEVTVDIARSESGSPVGAGLAVPIDATTFTADPLRRILTAVDGNGDRLLLESADTVALADDGAGGGLSLMLFASDLLGNPTDPGPVPMTIELEVGTALRIVAPDGDGDPAREMVAISTAAAVPIELDDAGGANDGGAGDRIIALSGGVPTATMEIHFGSGPPVPPSAMSARRTVLALPPRDGKDRIRLSATFVAEPASLDPVAQEVALTISDGVNVLYTRVFPAGSFVAKGNGRRFVYADGREVTAGRAKVVIRRRQADQTSHVLRVNVRGLEIPGAGAGTGQLLQTLRVGDAAFEATVICSPNDSGTSIRCFP